MKYQNIKKYAVVLFFFAYVTGAQAESGLIKDMVHFDQAYIPVLAMTSAGNVKASRVTFTTFEKVWHNFKNKHSSKSNGDVMWKSDFDKVDGYVRASKDIIQRGTNVKEAHEELEHVRVIFMHLRERNGIEYYVDKLTRFHEPMEKIVLAVKGKTAGTLTDDALSLIKSTLAEAKLLWHSVSNSKFDASLYEFNKPKAEMLKTLVKKEQVALAKLQMAVKANDKAQIIQAGLAIKPNFAKLFKAFGHFSN